MVSSLSKDEIDKLKRGGHDFKKLYAAFNAAVKTKGKPTVILAKTKKGYGMGKAGESKMTNHQQKELNLDALKEFRDRFQLDIPDNKLENMEFYKPDENSEEIKYLKKRREALGGSLPKRSFKEIELETPKIEKHSNFLFEESDREYSTTTGLVRSLGNIMRERTKVTKKLIESLKKLKLIVTSGMRNKSVNLEAAKKYKKASLENYDCYMK